MKDQRTSISFAFESHDQPYISSTRFGTIACLLAPFCLVSALALALEWGVLFASGAEEAWFTNMRRSVTEYEVPLDDSTMVSVESKLCFGYCPEYTLRLYGSGKVEFVGRRYVCDFGQHESTADTMEIRRLVEAMLAANFKGLPELATLPIPDSYLRLVTLQHGGHGHSVSYYDSYTDPDPRWLRSMIDELDRVAGTARWLPFVGQDWRLYCKSPQGQDRKLTMDPP